MRMDSRRLGRVLRRHLERRRMLDVENREDEISDTVCWENWST